MNTDIDLSRRLLKLFPVKLIKEYFNSDLFGENLFNDILRNNISNVIKDFAYVNLDYTKQHIYIFDKDRNVNITNINLNNFPYRLISNRIINNELHIIISPIVDFNCVINNPFEEVILKFHQPIKIVVTQNHIVYYVTILEKNMNSYFDNTRKLLDVNKINDEINTINIINDFFSDLNPIACDLNRGIKSLWENDIVDSKYAKWKKDRSTTTETMDESYTLKNQYPDVYQTIITAPLQKMIFKYLPENENFPEHFTLDPSIGLISIPTYPKQLNQNQNVVREILSNN